MNVCMDVVIIMYRDKIDFFSSKSKLIGNLILDFLSYCFFFVFVCFNNRNIR